MYSVKQKSKHKKIHLVLLGLVVLLVLVTVVYKQVNKKPAILVGQDGQTIKLEPATEDERKQANDRKQEIIKNDEALNNNDNSGIKQVNVVITHASAREVSAYVAGVFEEGGTCNVTASQGNTVYQKSSIGFGNVSSTQCPPIEWDTPLGSGSWSIVVAYSSPSAKGELAKTIEVN